MLGSVRLTRFPQFVLQEPDHTEGQAKAMLEIATWALLLSASIPILMCWATFSDEGSRFSIALLGLVTASYGWLLLASVVPFVAGPNYSGERVIVCNANIGLCLAAGIALAVTQKPRALFGLAGGWVAIGWVYFRAVSFVV